MTRPTAEHYVTAFERIHGGEDIYSCSAIVSAVLRDCNSSPLFVSEDKFDNIVEPYASLFAPLDVPAEKRNVFWLWDDPELFTASPINRFNWRVTALAFAIAMAEAGDL